MIVARVQLLPRAAIQGTMHLLGGARGFRRELAPYGVRWPRVCYESARPPAGFPRQAIKFTSVHPPFMAGPGPRMITMMPLIVNLTQGIMPAR